MTKTFRILSILVFILIILGGITRIMGAGLACPDWPLCHGKIIPPMDPFVFAEWFHRLIASVAGVLTLILAVAIVRTKRFANLLPWMIVAIATLFLQVWLGGATVWGMLASSIVTLHLLIGYTFFSSIVVMTLKSAETRSCAGFNGFGWMAFVLLLLSMTQVALGGLVSSNYAGLACPDFPTCFGQWVPPFEGLVRYQFLHRLGALLTTLLSIALLFQLKGSGLSKRGRKFLMIAGSLLIAQILLGVGLIHSELMIAMRIAHAALAIGFYASLLVTVYESRYHA